MSNIPSFDPSYSNKQPRLQEPHTYDGALARNPWPNTIERSMVPETTSTVTASNLHASVGPSGRAVSDEAIMRVPQAWGSWEHCPFGPGPEGNFPTPSYHGRPGGQLAPFPDYRTLGTPDGALAVATSCAVAVAHGSGDQSPYGTAQGTQGQETPSYSLATSQFAVSYNPPNFQYGLPVPDNQLGGSLEVYAQSQMVLDPPNLPMYFQECNLLSGPSSYQEVGGIIDDGSALNALDTESDLVCFGMLVGIPGTCRRRALAETSGYPIKLETPESFVGTKDPNLKGDVSPDSTYLTTALLEELTLELQVACTVSIDPPKLMSNGKPLRVSGLTSKCSLDIILYGPIELSDAICTFIEECNEYLEDQRKLYLQDPVGCDRNVRYCNPHRLPPLDPECIQFTFDLAHKRQNLVELEDIEPRPELMEILNSQEDLPEALQPPAIATSLERYQKQALTFMLRREQGWAFDGARPDIWEAVESGRGHCFTNRISDARQMDEPPAFYGGIIADPMGFGKTLTMIALVASDAHHPTFSDTSAVSGVLGEESCGLTLIIVPPPLLGTWEEELATHVVPLGLPWRLHHGKSRLTDPSELQDTALVLTTYHTVSTEWRNGSGRESSVLFTTRWRRVVLDEAHFIRNSESQMARAVCALNSVSRWAVTGTPLQNHLNDLAALLKFLNVYPYNEKRVFDADISHPWKAGNADEAVKRLKRLAGCLLLRRPKGTVQLPPRHDRACHVEFQPVERELYDQVRTQAIARFDEALLQGNHETRTASFVSVLQQIEAMRMVCNLGLLYPSRHDTSSMTGKMPDMDNWQETAQRGFNLRFEMGSILCHYCPCTLDATCNPLGDTESTKPLFAQCLRFICSSCVQGLAHRIQALGCGHNPPCPMAPVSTSASSLEESPLQISLGNVVGSAYLPTKVKALVEDLQALPGDVKCVVFSTWRMTLDVVESGLKQAGILGLRFDGKVPQRDRQGVVERFRNDPTIRVLLLTLSCGAVGLTLTAASRAYLMEPHWNPTLEDQALARIHRIGQKREVTTLRFYVRDSFEENIVKNQQFKRDLAGILLAPSGVAIDNMGHLKVAPSGTHLAFSLLAGGSGLRGCIAASPKGSAATRNCRRVESFKVTNMFHGAKIELNVRCSKDIKCQGRKGDARRKGAARIVGYGHPGG
ncbi:SNF2 family N-terminal domain-containing protein [Ilyonectria robusta]|uniref:SNF2 family N-terminal domain-containing protein n=1 Tax=Ilyonectria robusta TaxID=1079257 RepID=UPI001E8DBF04|nr:SNF2 family N-terminal domain-containing protein [Ilyonectria robusta]KAH8652844.1 SNF2 family N-terminal domain-containing protein [Ilyonectria robusta]